MKLSLLSCLFLLTSLPAIGSGFNKTGNAWVQPWNRWFECSSVKCLFRTKYKDTLITHERNHNQVKPFECELCLKKYSSKDSLSKHIKEKHSPDRCQFICHDCGRSFVYSYRLKKHLSIKTPCRFTNPLPSANLDSLLIASGLVLSDLTVMNDWHDSDDELSGDDKSVAPACTKRARTL
jgi:hypothetical protein